MNAPVPSRAWALIQRFDGKCHYCHRPVEIMGEESNRPTKEHLIPKCRGGLSVLSNIALACERCNSVKSDMTETEYLSFVETGILPESYVDWLNQRMVQHAVRRGIFVGRSPTSPKP